jgi:outer membrane protein
MRSGVKRLLLTIILWAAMQAWMGAAWAAGSDAAAGPLDNITELDLATAARIALADNPSLAAAQARVQQAAEAVRQAQSYYWPRLDTSLTAARVRLSDQDLETQLAMARFIGGPSASVDNPEDNYKANLTASWVLFDGFARKFNLATARHAEQGSVAAHADARRLLLSAVSAGFLSAQLAMENIAIAKADESFNQRQLTEAQLRYQVGTGALSDVLNFQVRVNSAKTQRIQAEQNFKVALVGLATLLALPQAVLPEHTQLAPVEPVSSTELVDPQPAELIDIARRQRPDLQQRDFRVQEAGAGIKAAEADFWPTITISASLDGQRYDNPGFENEDFGDTVAATLSYNIFAGGLHHARVQQAKARLHEAEKNLDDIRLSVAGEVQKAAARVRAAQEQLTLQQANAQLVQQQRDLVEKEYRAGVGSLVRLNEAQRDLIAAEVNLATARTALRQAWSDLQTATGEILQLFKS